jgi:hypothetical protein
LPALRSVYCIKYVSRSKGIPVTNLEDIYIDVEHILSSSWHKMELKLHRTTFTEGLSLFVD